MGAGFAGQFAGKRQKIQKIPLTNGSHTAIIRKLFRRNLNAGPHGGITQLVEYPVQTRYVICSSQIAATRPVGQAVKTPPFHGGNRGSIPVRVTMKRLPTPLGVGSLFISGLPVRESKRPTRRSRVKKCPVDTFLGRGRVEISKPPTIVREKPRQRQKGLGGHHEKPLYGNRRGAPGVNFGGQWPQPISHDSFLRIVTSLTHPVSSASPP